MKLNKSNYFSKKANKEFMSVSQFKSFSKCQSAALAELSGKYKREETTSLLVGSYVDAFFEGTLERFTKLHPEIFKKDGGLKAEYIQANSIIERINRDKLMSEYLSGRKQVIMTGTICGVAVKIKVDSLLPDKIVDLKIMKDFEDVFAEDKGGKVPWFEGWEYDLQGAVYQEIVRQNTGKKLPFYLVAATKEKVTDIDIIHIEQRSLDFELERFSKDLPFYDAIKNGIIEAESCGKCDYCKLNKQLTAPTESSEYYFI